MIPLKQFFKHPHQESGAVTAVGWNSEGQLGVGRNIDNMIIKYDSRAVTAVGWNSEGQLRVGRNIDNMNNI